ncbi:MAG: fused MFS/spermidine synthase [Alphaproteobacteria bacterium]|nr:fused MFS/spermidine synthase [Alphaproteobacteria bacterium]
MLTNKNRFLTLVLIFLTGYVGLALQLMVLRQVSHFVGSTTAITSIVIGIYLGAMTVGYFIGTKKLNININKTVSFSFLAIAVLTILACSFPLLSYYWGLMTVDKIHSPIIQTFIYSLLFMSVAPLLSGFNTAALSHNMHESERNNTGIILGVGTIGSVLGSLVTTLIFMALLGVNYTILLTVALAGIGAYIAHRKRWILATGIAILAIAWMFNNDGILYKRYRIVSNNDVNTVAVIESLEGRYLLIESALHSYISDDGKRAADYIDYINNHFVYSIRGGTPKEILVLGAGGFTLGNLDDHNNYTFVDIDRALKNISEKHFLKNKLSDNKRFLVQDAGQFLRTDGIDYDLIVMDVFSRWTIPESAITLEFMENMKKRLRPGGIIVINTIANPMFGDEFSKKLDNTMRMAFPHNLSRQIVGPYDGWPPDNYANILYIWNNVPNSGKIYNANKNFTVYDK